MASETISDIQHVVHIDSDGMMGCEQCQYPDLGRKPTFGHLVNHYIEEHGYKLLHVGQQTADSSEGLVHSTVAVLGTEQRPLRPPVKVDIPSNFWTERAPVYA